MRGQSPTSYVLRTSSLLIAARDSILARLYGVFVVLLVLPGLVVAQMVRIHLGDGAELRERGERQSESVIELAAQRGAILDRAGRALVVNTARYEVAADPTVAGFDGRAGELYAMLSRLTGRAANDYRQRVRDRASRQYVVLVRDLGEAAKEELVAADFDGLIVTGSYSRRYNYATRASHVLGHVTRDMRGVAGVEMLLDEDLQGEPGRQAVQRDRRGVVKAVVGGTRVEPRHGDNVVLTIDLVRQAILEEELARGVAEAGAEWGTAVALDPRTGAILALANVPTYDPNRAGAFSTAARRNHAVVDRIEPGSTFKLVTAVAAAESGDVGMSDVFDTGEGWRVFHGRTVKDTRGYGEITFGDAIAKSSNIVMAEAAERMGAGPLYQAARDLGFGQPTFVDLPGEVAGTLRRPEDWGRLTLTSMSRGYAVEVTPLQLAVAYAALANGGLLVRPYVVAERRDASTGETLWTARQDSVRRAFRASTSQTLMPHFEAVVSDDGTARRAEVEGLRVAGKTGTARRAADGGYTGGYRASFVGMFPVEAPEVVLAIVLHEPRNGYTGGAVAAPIFGATARRWVGTFPSIAERVAPSGSVPARPTASVPAVDGLPGVLAAQRLRAEGLTPRVDRDAPWVPVAVREGTDAEVALDRAVRLDRLGDEPASVMPDLRGRSVRQAVAWMRSLGVEVRVVGRGAVARQSVAPGGALPEAVTITGGRS
ncbi:MAG: penicillin-binding transpeptidase domain-containing protein [Bacteroidota bacterium]